MNQKKKKYKFVAIKIRFWERRNRIKEKIKLRKITRKIITEKKRLEIKINKMEGS